MYQSHRIWQSNGSAAHVARFVEPPGGAVALPDCPFANRSPSAAPGCFCSQITANAVIAKSEIRGLLPRLRSPRSESRRSARPVLPKPTLSPVPPVLSGRDQASATPSVAISDPLTGADRHENIMRIWQLHDCFAILTSGVSVTWERKACVR